MKRALLILFTTLIVLPSIAQQVASKKMSTMVRMVANIENNNHVRSLNKAKVIASENTPSLCAFVRIEGDADAIFNRYGCRRLATFGDIYIADIPMGNLNAMACERSVLRIEASPSRTGMLERSSTVVGADKVHAGTSLPQAFTGAGVVVGIVDIGFDLTNPNFYNEDQSQYRIVRFWDMLSTDTIGSDKYVGADYTTKDAILAYQHSRDGLLFGHSAHTLGDLAGTEYGTPYRGMAYESEIVATSNAVTSDTVFIKKEDRYKYTSATDALGFKYAFDYAESQGKPCVVSFSEGGSQALDSDEQLNYEVLRQMTGPGRIIVASAGNEGHYQNYIHKTAGTQGQGTFVLGSSDKVLFRASTDGDFTLRFNAYDDAKNAVSLEYKFSDILADADSLINDTVVFYGREYAIALGAYPNVFQENRVMLDGMLKSLDGELGHVTPVSMQLLGLESDVELFRISGLFLGSSTDPSLNNAVKSHTINAPSSAPAVICVGASTYCPRYTNYWGDEQENYDKEEGVIAYYSSRGPTYDGRIKPDVVAPGTNIMTTSSSFVYENTPYPASTVALSEFNGRTYPWLATQGTSLSTPIVAGCIALWLQADPTLTPDDIITLFRETCNHLDTSLTYPNNIYGYGEIDVYRGLLHILGIDGIEGISQEQPRGVTFALEGGSRLRISYKRTTEASVQLRIYNTAGSLLLIQQLPSGQESSLVDMSSLPAGVYAVQLTSSDPMVSGSTLVRIVERL